MISWILITIDRTGSHQDERKTDREETYRQTDTDRETGKQTDRRMETQRETKR